MTQSKCCRAEYEWDSYTPLGNGFLKCKKCGKPCEVEKPEPVLTWGVDFDINGDLTPSGVKKTKQSTPPPALLTDEIDEQIYRAYHGNYDGVIEPSLIEHLRQNQPFLWRIAALAFAAGEQAQKEKGRAEIERLTSVAVKYENTIKDCHNLIHERDAEIAELKKQIDYLKSPNKAWVTAYDNAHEIAKLQSDHRQQMERIFNTLEHEIFNDGFGIGSNKEYQSLKASVLSQVK